MTEIIELISGGPVLRGKDLVYDLVCVAQADGEVDVVERLDVM
jgi:hypothetical protein